MSKKAEEYYRNKLIEQATSERKKKFLKLVDFSREAKIMQEYADQQFSLTDVGNPLKCDFCGADEIYPNLDIRLYQCKCGATKSF